MTDPIWSSRASPLSFLGPKRYTPPGVPFDDLPPVDVILISHNHYDHLDRTTVARLVARFPAAAWLLPLGLAGFVRGLGAPNVIELEWHDHVECGGIRFTCAPAQHFSGRSLSDRDLTLWCGWIIRTDDRTVLFAGDTALHPSFTDIGRRYGPFDLALLPIGAYDPRWFMKPVHMDPKECVTAVEMISAVSGVVPFVLATHWGTFPLTDEPVHEPPALMRAEWARAGFDESRLWILAPGETRRIE